MDIPLKIKSLRHDADAIILLVIVALYVVLPSVAIDHVANRLNDPIAYALLSAAGLGRFYVRGKVASGEGRRVAGKNIAKAQNNPNGVR